ncbi:MAG: SUMF1/EgtB/PvdO family nonheme iron enzyme [Anaerolineae bacterium]|nr:SUMF1/EgtB/PvdO family nonheme iron enzyme [Anaerolineae bacterium]
MKFDRRLPSGILVAATLLAGCSAGIVSVPTATSTPPPTQQPTMVTAAATDKPATATPEPPTQTPTDEPTMEIPDAVITLALAGVSRNDDWEPYIEEINGVEMALVPAGCFMMGSEGGDSDESPVHEVCFEEPFWIDVYEMTNKQVGGAASNCTSHSFSGNQPAICINWYDSLAHCEDRGARLPTEAEWEYAARGPDNLIYPWGNTFVADNTVYGENNPGGTASVGSKPGGVSWVGANDLSGNVWEWVNDWYDEEYYGTLADGVINPLGPDTGDDHVMRGGPWDNHSSIHMRSANRSWNDPDSSNFNLGFRCALSHNP